MPNDQPTSTLLRDAAAIGLGLTVPAMVSGRAVLQGLAAAALIAVLIIAWQDRRIFSRVNIALRSRLGIAVVAAFAAMAVSIPGSLDPLRSVEAWGRSFAYILGCTLFWAFLSGDPRARRLCLRTFVAAFIFGLTAIFIGQLGWELPYRVLKNDFVPWNSNWPFDNAKAYAAAAACGIPLCLWIFRQECGLWRGAAGLATCGQALLVVTTINKSALAGILAMILAVSLAVVMRRGRRWLAAWALGAVVATTAILLLVYELPDEPAARPVWDWLPPQIVDTHRQQIWHFSAEKIAEKPWIGYGINIIDRIPGANEILPGYSVEAIPSHPHNWVLEILGETGAIGFLPVVVAIGWAAMRGFRRFVRAGDAAALAQLGITAGFWSSSLFNFSIWSSWWLISYFLLMAIAAAGRTDEA